MKHPESEMGTSKRTINYSERGWENINFKEIIAKLLGLTEDKLLSISELSGGYFNKVMLIETPKSKQVAKISPLWNPNGLIRENFVYSQLPDCPEIFSKPEVHSFTPTDNNLLPGHNIIIMDFIEGRKPTEADLNSPKLHQRLAAFLETVHQIPTQGYGWLNQDLIGSDKTWKDFLINIDNIEITKVKGILPATDIEKLITDLTRECDNNFTPKLLYGDLNNSNIIIKEPEIYIVDYENCFAGHDLYDQGIGLFFIPQIEQNLDTYLKHEPSTKELRQITLYAMRHALSALGHRLSANIPEEVDKAIKRFNQLKENLKRLG